MAIADTSREPLQNLVAKGLGIYKGWRVVLADGSGNALIADSLRWEVRYDYDTRTDGQPVYIGFAQPGTATSTEAWLIHKFTFDGSNNVTRRQVVTDKAWDNRTTSF